MNRKITGNSAAGRAGLALGAVVSAMLLASPAHAETNNRVCGIVTKSSSSPGETVGFVMKVKKGDNRTCTAALDTALSRFNAVGGTTNRQGLDRIWRRVRGGTVGPFNGKRVFNQSFSLTTCEDFSWYVSTSSEDFCFRMTRNKLYALAAANGEFATRGE